MQSIFCGKHARFQTGSLLLFLLVSLLAPGIAFSQAENAASQKAAKAKKALPLLLRGPYLQVATSNSIIIRWRTDTYDRSRVWYGSSPADLSHIADDSTLVTEHIVRLSGLQPETRYYYAIGDLKDTLQRSPGNYFYALPEPGDTGLYRIGVFGDMGNNSINQRNVRDQFIKYLGDRYMNAWVLVGDNAYSDGTDAEFQAKFFNIYDDNLLRKYPLFPSPGNHDYHDIESAGAADQNKIAYYQSFSVPSEGEAGGVPSHTASYYSYDIGNIHFLALDSYGKDSKGLRFYDAGSEQMEWIKKDLEANKGKEWIIAYWHHPPYTMGSHNSDKSSDLVKIREVVAPVMEQYGVDLVLCGHSHDYERSRLMKGHFGLEATFDSSKYDISSSSGLYDGSKNSAPYIKDSKTNKGTVYVVTGSAGQFGGKQTTFPHDAMQYSNADIGGATILEIQGNRLDLKWICSDGVIRDHFTMMKDVNIDKKVYLKKGETATLTASYIGDYTWSNGEKGKRSIQVGANSRTYTVQDKYGCLKDSFHVIVSKK